MTPYSAVMIAEDYDDSDPRYYEAWQYLVDTGIVWTLQGWFGRRAMELIESGDITTKGFEGEKMTRREKVDLEEMTNWLNGSNGWVTVAQESGMGIQHILQAKVGESRFRVINNEAVVFDGSDIADAVNYYNDLRN